MSRLVWRSVDGAVLDQTSSAGPVYRRWSDACKVSNFCSRGSLSREAPRNVGCRFVLSGAFCPAVILEELKKPRACMKAAWITRASASTW